MRLKPSRLIPILAAVLLAAGWTTWGFASDAVPHSVIVGLWAAAFLIALAPLVLVLLDHATGRQRPRRGTSAGGGPVDSTTPIRKG